MIADHRNYDGVHREMQGAPLNIMAKLKPHERDTALEGYFDSPRPANDNKRVYRSIKSNNPYHCICSSRWKYVDVALPRVRFLDGPYLGATNDNMVVA